MSISVDLKSIECEKPENFKMERTPIESAAHLMLEAYKSTRKMVDALDLVSSKDECAGVPYNVLHGMWLAVDACHELNT